MTRELKLGILTFITLFAAIWGYTFIKGQNLFKPSFTYYATFPDVTGLAVSADVLVNGFKIGNVSKIEMNPDDVKQMNVYINVDNKVGIPSDAEVQMKNDGIMGGKYIALSFTKPCNGDCAPSNTKLKSKTVGLMGSMLAPEEFTTYIDNTTKTARNLIDNLGKEGNDAKLDLIIRNLEASLANMNNVMIAMNKMVMASQNNITGTTANFNKITKNLADNNAQITAMLTNLNTTSKQLAAADVSNTIAKTNALMDASTQSVKGLETTLNNANVTIASLNSMFAKMSSGDGSLSLLMNDKKLYNNLESTSKNMNLLLQDFRLNPKRYLNVSIIGRKDKPYVLPEVDPASIEEIKEIKKDKN
jgi:phospholipid/cholesterol/gamma-HCH transport system substrate-binding protein